MADAGSVGDHSHVQAPGSDAREDGELSAAASGSTHNFDGTRNSNSTSTPDTGVEEEGHEATYGYDSVPPSLQHAVAAVTGRMAQIVLQARHAVTRVRARSMGSQDRPPSVSQGVPPLLAPLVVAPAPAPEDAGTYIYDTVPPVLQPALALMADKLTHIVRLPLRAGEGGAADTEHSADPHRESSPPVADGNAAGSGSTATAGSATAPSPTPIRALTASLRSTASALSRVGNGWGSPSGASPAPAASSPGSERRLGGEATGTSASEAEEQVDSGEEDYTYGYDSLPPTLTPAFRTLTGRVRALPSPRDMPISNLAKAAVSRAAEVANDTYTKAAHAAEEAQNALAERAEFFRMSQRDEGELSESGDEDAGSESGASARRNRHRSNVSVKMFVKDVTNFSSQYGLTSYSASGLVGPPRIYPRYGDFTSALVLRTYGSWWLKSPDAAPPVSKFSQRFTICDFVEVSFETNVFPTKITIFETYNPGAIVRILAFPAPGEADTTSSWFVLWEGPPQHAELPHLSRAFSPPLRPCPFPTSLIRLEFDHRGLDYYAEIDAVQLQGDVAIPRGARKLQVVDPEAIQKREEANRQLVERYSLANEEGSLSSGVFDLLPDEMIMMIFDKLDFLDILTVSCVCRRFFALGYKVHMGYTALDLQPFWSRLNDNNLSAIAERCTNLERLSLSWSGAGHGLLTAQGLESFARKTGSKLTCLRLACCSYVTSNVLKDVVLSCPLISDLDLQCCTRIETSGFACLSGLKNLERLNLYNTMISAADLTNLFPSWPRLKHLNLGHCLRIMENADTVVDSLSINCPELQSLDFWRARSLSAAALCVLAHRCTDLRALDVGWCRDVDCQQFIPTLARSCTKLRKLFLTALRTITNPCLEALAQNCPELEQLDFLGSGLISPDAVLRVLEACPNIELLDISFCRQVTAVDVRVWKERFPKISFKKSFVS